jgi:hypothetical protein
MFTPRPVRVISMEMRWYGETVAAWAERELNDARRLRTSWRSTVAVTTSYARELDKLREGRGIRGRVPRRRGRIVSPELGYPHSQQ